MGCGISSNDAVIEKQPLKDPYDPNIDHSNLDNMYCAPEKIGSLPDLDIKKEAFGDVLENGDVVANKVPKKKFVLTPEEIKAKLEGSIYRLKNTKDYFSEESLADFSYLNRRFSSSTRNEDKSINLRGVELGLIELCYTIWKTLFDNSDFLDPKDTLTWTVMKRVLVILWNGSDRLVEVCVAIMDLDIHKYSLEILQNPKIIRNDDDELTDRQIYTIKGFFGVVHNLLGHLGERTRTAFRELGAVNVFQKQLDAQNIMVRTKAYINLAYLVTEEENHLINADSKNIKHIVAILESAIEAKNRFSKRYGFSALETVEALNKLAVNDENKEKILQAGALTFYEELLLSESDDSYRQEIIRGIWILSFSPSCRQEINNMPDTMACIRDQKKSDNNSIRKYAEGALWILDGKSQKQEVSDKDSIRSHGSSEDGHIMISYNWGSKPMALQLRQHLQKAGFKIWMDVDNMTGSTLQAMADAVEKANVVLVCMSQKYKESPSCRTEAEYTYQLRKPFIPLRFEKGYKADGWLGIMIGTKLWFDFVKNFSAASSGLVKELKTIGFTGSNTSQRVEKEFVPEVTSSKPSYMKWGENQVKTWLNGIGLASNVRQLDGMDGSLLAEYDTMRREAPEFFYSTLRNDLKLSLLDILKFTKALSNV